MDECARVRRRGTNIFWTSRKLNFARLDLLGGGCWWGSKHAPYSRSPSRSGEAIVNRLFYKSFGIAPQLRVHKHIRFVLYTRLYTLIPLTRLITCPRDSNILTPPNERHDSFYFFNLFLSLTSGSESRGIRDSPDAHFFTPCMQRVSYKSDFFRLPRKVNCVWRHCFVVSTKKWEGSRFLSRTQTPHGWRECDDSFRYQFSDTNFSLNE